MTVEWDGGTAISGDGDVTPGAPFWRVDMDTIPGWFGVNAETPPRYRYLGRVGAIDGDYRTYGESIVYAQQEGTAELVQNTSLYWALEFGVSGTLYRGVGSMSSDDVGARIYRATAQAIPDNTATPIVFSNTLRDPWGMWSASVNPERLTAPAPGWYHVGAALRWTPNVTGNRGLWLRHNNGETIVRSTLGPVADVAQPLFQFVDAVYYFPVLHYIEALAFQNSGGSLSTVATADVHPDMWMVRVG